MIRITSKDREYGKAFKKKMMEKQDMRRLLCQREHNSKTQT